MLLTTELPLQLHEQSLEIYTFELNDIMKGRKFLYLAGINVGHSVAAPMHSHIAKLLGIPWTFITKISACNNVYLNQQNRLCGSNTDWRGVVGSLLNSSSKGVGKPALVIGAGGASRAAIYALYVELNCEVIYIINRDTQEVEDLCSEMKAYSSNVCSGPQLVHVTSMEQVNTLPAPFYVVGTVPDVEPRTVEELKASAIIYRFLDSRQGGVLLDMCYKPRNTRLLKYGRSRGWMPVDGTAIIGYQIEEQWRLWTGKNTIRRFPTDEAWMTLNRTVEMSTMIDN